MRWITRHAVFALYLSLGTSAWYALAQKESAPAQPTQAVEETPINQTEAQTDSEQPEEAPGQSIKFGPVETLSGHVNTKTIILRQSADANAPVVAKLKVGDYEWAEILGATRDFVHVRIAANDGADNGGNVRERDYEGWTTWGSVVPEMSAIVLDAETGAVVSRVPLGEGISSVTFSPDGSRAIFSSGINSVGRAAYEVRTSDYTLTRRLTSSSPDYFGTLFYGPADGRLYATFHQSDESEAKSQAISLIRIGEDGAPNASVEIETDRTLFFVVSPDGLTGFRAHAETNEEYEVMVDVIDLATLNVRNTFTLSGMNLSSDSSEFILNKDGSELYVRLSRNTGTILVVGTYTGQLMRELSDSSTEGSSYFSQGDLVGDSVLLRVWDGGDEAHPGPQKFWVGSGKRMLAAPGVDYAVEAGGKRYAVNDDGTLLFKLDDNNRIQERRLIDRPERRKGADVGNGPSVFGLSASPDGKHIIILLGIEHGC